MTPPLKQIDLICFSHLRWNFVYQRPQHLMSRCALKARVFFIEEPVYDAPSHYNEIVEDPITGIIVVTPHITSDASDILQAQRQLLNMFVASMNIQHFIAWYYTPLAFAFSDHLNPELIVYDCMDELSSSRFASPALKDWEARLSGKADLVFTGSMHLYEAKKHLHSNIHPFPGGIDVDHFFQARDFIKDPPDQVPISHPRIGFYGVIDERFNINILEELADRRKDWHFIIIGPIAKIDPKTLPVNTNIHFTGVKDYKELPAYLSGWDVAIMPFELNEATKYISPTKTLEFLAAGKPVVSTAIHDVIYPYAEKGFVSIADTAEGFVIAIEELLTHKKTPDWFKRVDEFLGTQSWDDIWDKMKYLMSKTLEKKIINPTKTQAYV